MRKPAKHHGLSTVLLALAIAVVSAPAAALGPAESVEHDMTEARVIDRVILAVMEYYYDPARVDPEGMFEAAMDSLQKTIAEVKVSYDEKSGWAEVEVVENKLKVDVGEIRSPWALSRALRSVLEFMDQHLPQGENDPLEVEYRMANGILQTLDPHSNALPPDLYEDLRMGTSGEFGGLGIRITTDRRPPCNGTLTVVEVFENTPAARAGFKAGDKILRIEGESTVNITTSEAAERLRGSPGTKVDVQVKRKDGSLKELEITRRLIPIESVEWKLLDGDVGYISLEAFQGNSAIELQGALAALHARGMKGLILDLRGNPGGLLDVAIKVADKFLKGGTIVATAGRREEEQSVRNATAAGTEPSYPLVLLINSTSASAAEIISGAMRNHGRALLVGDTSFGKGSVQMVLPLPGGGALRLTSAQYLVPGDISIQAVGVAPDVTFTPVTVDKDDLRIDRREPRFSEADLEHHLDRPTERERGDRPGAIVSTLHVPVRERKADQRMFERCYTDDPDRETFRTRHETDFARRLIAGSSGETAEELLLDAREILDEDTREQERAVGRALKKLGIDWTPAPNERKGEASAHPKVTATATVVGKPKAGSKLRVRVTVKNGSNQTIYRLRATSKSDNPLLSGHEFVFGKLLPGKSKGWTTAIELPPIVKQREDPLKLAFRSDLGPLPTPVKVDVAMPARAEAELAYSWEIEDLGNGNGFFEPGEDLLMRVAIENIGAGSTFDLDAMLSAKPGIDVSQGRFAAGRLKPGDRAEGVFRLGVGDKFGGDEASLKLAFEEWVPARLPTTRTLLERSIDLPVSTRRPGPGSASGAITVVGESDVELRESPAPDARAISVVDPGSSFSVDGKLKGFYRVKLGRQRHAWIAEEKTRPGGGGRSKASATMVRPPEIRIDGGPFRRVSTKNARLRGRATHAGGIRDLMVFVGERKVAYLPHRSGDDDSVEFDVDLPLEKGANRIVVVARHDSNVVATKSIFIRRLDR
jgi:carboxyl-terminal processing protease